MIRMSETFIGEVECEKEVTFHSLIDSALEAHIEGPLAPYTVSVSAIDWPEGQTGRGFKVQFTISTSLLGNRQEKVILKFLDSSIITSQGQNLETVETWVYSDKY